MAAAPERLRLADAARVGPARAHLDGVAVRRATPWATARRRPTRRAPRGPPSRCAVSRFEPVTVVVDPAPSTSRGDWLGEGRHDRHRVDLLEAPLDDAWMRDIGPTFVLGADGRSARSTGCSTAGAPSRGRRGTRTPGSARSWPARAGATRIASDLVNEGGGIHVDGLGTVLLTETVQLDPGRNPGLTRADVEAELARTIGATTCIWLPRGLTPRLRRVRHPRARRHRRDLRVARGRAAALAGRPGAPRPRGVGRARGAAVGGARRPRGAARGRARARPRRPSRTTEGPVDWSYINHLVVNDGVVACTYDDPQDADSLAVLERAYAGRRVVGVDARPLFDRGGGIHCITQQQPRT